MAMTKNSAALSKSPSSAQPDPARAPSLGSFSKIFQTIFAGGNTSDDDLRDIEDAPPAIGANIVKIVVVLFLAFLGWAAFTQVDEVTRGEGRVIPSSRVQVIQSAEAGVVSEIVVREGVRVERGDILLRLDDTSISSNLGEFTAQSRALEAAIERLNLEYEGDIDAPFVCPDEIAQSVPEVCANEQRLREARRESLQSQLDTLRQRVEQRQRELNEVQSNVRTITDSLELARDELALLAPLAERQVVAATDLLQVRREVNDLEGQRRSAQEAIARVQAELREANLQLEGQVLAFRQDALAELAEKQSEFAVLSESIRGAADRVKNTDIRSPVEGIVNTLYINTVGAFVNAGARVMDIVPIEDQLLVEARVLPQDIAFISPGQPATVKISAYDFSIYGSLNGEVDQVSASSVLDEATRETFYTVVVRTDKTTLSRNNIEYPIMPGMITNVEILTGKKSILTYLLKPINKARTEALTER
jgi:adhesin transport system membrane fusion protein